MSIGVRRMHQTKSFFFVDLDAFSAAREMRESSDVAWVFCSIRRDRGERVKDVMSGDEA